MHRSHLKTKKEGFTVCNWIQQFGSSHNTSNKYIEIAGSLIDESINLDSRPSLLIFRIKSKELELNYCTRLFKYIIDQ